MGSRLEVPGTSDDLYRGDRSYRHDVEEKNNVPSPRSYETRNYFVVLHKLQVNLSNSATDTLQFHGDV